MRMKTFPLILGLAAIMVIGSVSATWKYADENKIEDFNNSLNIQIAPGEYHWVGSDVLPNDKEEGLSHFSLIQKIISNDVGLGNSGSYLNEQIDSRIDSFSRTVLGSMAIKQGEDLQNIFTKESRNLNFLIEFKEYKREWLDYKYMEVAYLYTTEVYLGTNGNLAFPIGEYIYPVYRTKIVRQSDGSYKAESTDVGKAKSDYYDENQYININRSEIPSWDPDSFTSELDLGNSFGGSISNAIMMNTGYRVTVNLAQASPLYYKFTVKNTKNFVFSLQDSSCALTLYDSSGTQIASASNGYLESILTAGQTYYVKCEGNKDTTLMVREIQGTLTPNQQVTVTSFSLDGSAYYKLIGDSYEYSVASSTANVSLTVYNSNFLRVNVTTENGAITWRGTQGMIYYIVANGADSININLTV